MAEGKLRKIKDKEEKLREELRKLKEEREKLEKELQLTRLAPVLLHFVLPFGLTAIKGKAPEVWLGLLLLLRCNKGRATTHLDSCIKNLYSQLEEGKQLLKERFGNSAWAVVKLIEEAQDKLSEIAKLPNEEKAKVVSILRKKSYHTRVVAVLQMALEEVFG